MSRTSTPTLAKGASTAEPTSGADLFLKNLRALWRCDPQLALAVDAVNDEERIPLEAARAGGWTCRRPADDGTSIYLHSRHDPRTEAKRFAAALDIEEAYCFVVSGMGLGYHLQSLFERLPHESVVVCCEPHLPMIATALTCVDLSKWIAARRLILLMNDDKARLHALFRPIGTMMMLGARFLSHAPSVRLADRAQAAISKAVAEFVTFQRMSLMTLVANSRTTCRNVAMNLVHYVSTPPLDVLRNRFEGDPAVVIAAGPSLSRNLEQLAEWKGKAVLIAVQTALKPLLQQGIVPDFVTTLDFHEISRNFFEGIRGLENVHLVAEPKVAWQVLDYYPGPMSVLGNSWAQLLLGDKLGARDGLRSGATVAHLAFYLAEYMGCQPIIFVGLDLAFTGHVFYVPGVEIHKTWQAETNRYSTMEHKEWERIARNRPILRRVPGSHGGELYTDELLATYLEQFEKDVARAACPVINATEGGAQIRGTQGLSLRDASSRFLTRSIDPTRFDYRFDQTGRSESRLEQACHELDHRIKELDEAAKVCDELLELLKALDDLTHDAAKFNQKLVRVDDLRTRIAQDSRPYQIINAATQHAELRRYSADRRIEAATMDDAQRAKRQIRRDLDFITGVRDGIRDVQPMLREAQKRLELRLVRSADPLP